jgi:CRISPR-associated protein Csm3
LMNKWEKVIRFKFQINAEEGLRIAGSGGGLEIGEMVDANLAAIRDAATGQPYIPGSSLKGKLRSTLERKLGKCADGQPCRCGETGCVICTIFGAHMNSRPQCGPTRIVVRDAFLSKESLDRFNAAQKEGRPVFELKTENTINRSVGTAEHPRTGERVLRGTAFDGEILLHIYAGDKADQMRKEIRNGLAIIQEASSVGGSGSRGYGKVRFDNFREEEIPLYKMELKLA